MIPAMLQQILDIMGDLTDDYQGPFRKLDDIPEPLWEGFVEDIREEFGVPGMLISPDWTVMDLHAFIVEERGKEVDELPEFTLVIHVNEDIVNDVLDDFEAVLEKYASPYGMAAYVAKDGKLERQPLRRSSDDGIFKYHAKFMGLVSET